LNQVVEQFRAPNAIEPGPQSAFLRSLLVGLQLSFAEMARRVNLTSPKDGSELQRMSSYDSVDFAMAANADDADIGYYTIARVTLSGGSHDLTGIADGAGQEGAGGRLLRIINTSASALTLTLKHDTTSTAGNRFYLPGGGDYTVAQYEAAQLWYDLASLRWRVAA
jgi:hypothetical protein